VSSTPVTPVTSVTPAAPVVPVLAGDSLRQQVTDALRAALVTGRMAPGDVWSAPQLAERFGVSVTPVREALLELAKDGLVEAVRNRGFRVSTPTPAELDAASDVRLLLEPPAAARAAALPQAARRAAVDELRPLARAVVDAARAGDVVAHVQADRAFHARFLAMAGNPVLTDTVLRLRDRARLYGLPALVAAGTLDATAAEHQTMCELLLAGDGEALSALVAAHVGHVRGEWSGTSPDVVQARGAPLP
jgi:DNA-binding GntR family transcriptional regulator